MNELQKLCDKVPSFNNDDAMQVINDELGAPWYEVGLIIPFSLLRWINLKARVFVRKVQMDILTFAQVTESTGAASRSFDVL